MPLDELREPALAGAAGGDLRLKVAEHLGRLPGVLLDDAEERLVLRPRVVELEERQAKAFLEDLGRVDGDAPGRDAADVGVVGERRRVPLELVVDEDRLDHVDVGQVLPAVAVRVVGDEDVSRTRRVGVLLAEVAHHRREAPELHREREALRDEAAVAVAEGRGVVHRVPDDRRVRAPHQDERHLVRVDASALRHLERDRVEPLVSRHATVTSTLPKPSSRAEHPGGTTIVESYSSTRNGPRRSTVEQRGSRHDRRGHRPVACAEVRVPVADLARARGDLGQRVVGRRVRARDPGDEAHGDELDRVVSRPVPVRPLVLGDEVVEQPVDGDPAGRHAHGQLVCLTGIAEVGEALDVDRVRPGAPRPRAARARRARARRAQPRPSPRRARRERRSTVRTSSRSLSPKSSPRALKTPGEGGPRRSRPGARAPARRRRAGRCRRTRRSRSPAGRGRGTS